jgi:hypothetical protein
MLSEAKFQWVWRGMVVVLLGITLRVTLMLLLEMHSVQTPIGIAWQQLGGTALVGYHIGRSVAFTLPTAVLALCVFAHFLNRTVEEEDDECHCRRCGYILRGLSAPRCPECGEAI